MIGDPLYEAIKRRREAEDRKRLASNRAIEARPEGVTIYRCVGLIGALDPASETPEEDVVVRRCEERSERKPYLTIPYHHGLPMAIEGYDWNRDVDA